MSIVAVSVMVVVALATALLSSVTGVAGGVLLLSGLLLVVPAAAVVPLHGTVQLVAGASRVIGFWGDVRRDIAWRFVGGLVPGSLLGAYLFSVVLDVAPGLLEVLIAVAILVSFFAKPNKPKPAAADGAEDAEETPQRLGQFYVYGFVCGALGIVVGSTGPLVTQGLLRANVVKGEHVATKSLVQATANLIKLPIFGLALSFDYGAYALPLLLMCIAAVIGTYAGKLVLDRMAPERFVWVAKVLLVLVALKILVTETVQALAL
jgi:uncharacterized membrane protein YfcA